ncbi:MAG: TPM domain-containing protein [Desulfobacteraceae bacterium]|jgi:uncharacterized protein
MKASIRKPWHWIVLSIVIVLFSSEIRALDVPHLKARVNDHARMLGSSAGRQLETVLAELERTDGTQVVLLTIDSLKGDSLEDFSIRVVEKWKLGQKDFDNGVLLLIAKNDRKIRIEVGYGLEGKLTDLVSGRIIRNVIAPQFKMGRFDQGILDGISAIIGVVRGEYTAPRAARRSRSGSGVSSGLVPIIALIFFANMLGRIHRFAGAAAGGVLTPIVAAIFFNPGIALLLGLIPIGFGAGLLMSYVGGPVSFGHAVTRRHRSRYWGGGMSGGGFGGFSGGGGGFGGGGASGGW